MARALALADPCVAKFICPKCGGAVVCDADLEGHAADCALCGTHVSEWPPPIRKTRKPGSRWGLVSGNELALRLLVLLVFILILVAIFRR